MNFFKSTFYNKYTPLTVEQISAKLKPTPMARSVSPLSEVLSGKSLKIVLDNGPTLEYEFTAKDRLTFSEGAMQWYCSEYKTDLLLNMGLDNLRKIEKESVPQLYALDPHKLMRCVEDLSLVTNAQIILVASLARQASSVPLDFQRIDYPTKDPPQWNKFLTLKLENEKVKIGELPLTFWGNMKQNYETYNKDYTGVHKG